MQVADLDFELPASLIAQEPSAVRGGSRLLILHRATGAVEHAMFSALPSFLRAGDLVVLNDTRVFPARLLGERVPSGGAVECLLLQEIADPLSPSPGPVPSLASPALTSPPAPVACWSALMHPGQKLKPGARVLFAGDGSRLHGEVLAQHFHGRRSIRLWTDDGGDVAERIERIGHMPLPPYIRRDDRPADRDRYQTVYARARGSVAAPTAGLHVTEAILEDLRARGVETAAVTLHVGYGTFKPVRVDRVEDHVVDPERFSVAPSAASALSRARRDGRRIIAVGTTTVRALESLTVSADGSVAAGSGEARVFIHPGHPFTLVDGLVTNFHLPKSSLLMLVSAFGGRERVLAAYREAVAGGYRFYSYGDAMLIT